MTEPRFLHLNCRTDQGVLVVFMTRIELRGDELTESVRKELVAAVEHYGSVKVVLDLDTVQTNILVFGLAADAPDAPTVVARAKERGVLIFAFGPRTIRAVTHLDVSKQQCERAAEVLLEAVGG